MHATGLPAPCPVCGGEFRSRTFKLMFESLRDLTQTEENKAYLRPETAQGIFLNYKNVLDTYARQSALRHRDRSASRFATRSRRETSSSARASSSRWRWSSSAIRKTRPSGTTSGSTNACAGGNRSASPPEICGSGTMTKDELAHYSKMCVDVEYKYPFTAPGFGELEGIAHRGCFDLTQHQEHSGKDLNYFDQERQVELQNRASTRKRSRSSHATSPTSSSRPRA